MQLISEMTVRPIQQMGGDSMVVAAAKVSVSGQDAASWVDQEANFGLINFLMKHRHGTPFEHSAITFFVHAPIFVFREWHRHRIGHSFNEESARYKPLDPVFWIPRRDRPMIPVPGWKPGKPKFMTIDESLVMNKFLVEAAADEVYDEEIERNRQVYELAYKNYQESVKAGFAMEVARCKLPVGIYSSCWVTVNPRSLMAFLSLRTHDPEATFISYPQAEIEECARLCEQMLAEYWPLTHKAFVANGRVGP